MVPSHFSTRRGYPDTGSFVSGVIGTLSLRLAVP
jgi:hypothetical protein